MKQQPKTSDEIAEMMRTGKGIDAAARRAVRQAIGKPAKTKARAKSAASRRKRRKAA